MRGSRTRERENLEGWGEVEAELAVCAHALSRALLCQGPAEYSPRRPLWGHLLALYTLSTSTLSRTSHTLTSPQTVTDVRRLS
eukprot:scaffold23640_cov132-Isochrysis_galbana.AAC.5